MSRIVKSKKWINDNPGLVKAWRAQGHTVSSGGSRSSKRKSTKTTKKGGRKMAKKSINILPLVAGAVGTGMGKYGGTTAFSQLERGKLKEAGLAAQNAWSGYNVYNGKWKWQDMTGIGGLALGALGSKLGSKLGVNRYLPKGWNL